MKCGALVAFAVLAILPEAAAGQALSVWEKAEVHARRLVSPGTLAGALAGSAINQWRGEPEAWGGGMAGYGRRFGSSEGRTILRESFAFALDVGLRTDPRQHRSGQAGVRNRLRDALLGTVVTRTDAGRRTFNAAQVGGRIGAEFLANTWYPDGENTTRHAFTRAGIGIGLAAARRTFAEFWPDIKTKIFHRRGAGPRSTTEVWDPGPPLGQRSQKPG